MSDRTRRAALVLAAAIALAAQTAHAGPDCSGSNLVDQTLEAAS